MTVACARSGLTRTPVTVTSPWMRGSERADTSSPTISFSCDSTLRVRPLMAIAPSKLHELLAPVEDRQLFIVKKCTPDLLAFLLGRAPGDRGERELHGGALPDVMVIRLDNRDVLAAQAVLDGAEDLALLLQAGGEGKLQ